MQKALNYSGDSSLRDKALKALDDYGSKSHDNFTNKQYDQRPVYKPYLEEFLYLLNSSQDDARKKIAIQVLSENLGNCSGGPAGALQAGINVLRTSLSLEDVYEKFVMYITDKMISKLVEQKAIAYRNRFGKNYHGNDIHYGNAIRMAMGYQDSEGGLGFKCISYIDDRNWVGETLFEEARSLAEKGLRKDFASKNFLEFASDEIFLELGKAFAATCDVNLTMNMAMDLQGQQYEMFDDPRFSTAKDLLKHYDITSHQDYKNLLYSPVYGSYDKYTAAFRSALLVDPDAQVELHANKDASVINPPTDGFSLVINGDVVYMIIQNSSGVNLDQSTDILRVILPSHMAKIFLEKKIKQGIQEKSLAREWLQEVQNAALKLNPVDFINRAFIYHKVLETALDKGVMCEGPIDMELYQSAQNVQVDRDKYPKVHRLNERISIMAYPLAERKDQLSQDMFIRDDLGYISSLQSIFISDSYVESDLLQISEAISLANLLKYYEISILTINNMDASSEQKKYLLKIAGERFYKMFGFKLKKATSNDFGSDRALDALAISIIDNPTVAKSIGANCIDIMKALLKQKNPDPEVPIKTSDLVFLHKYAFALLEVYDEKNDPYSEQLKSILKVLGFHNKPSGEAKYDPELEKLHFAKIKTFIKISELLPQFSEAKRKSIDHLIAGAIWSVPDELKNILLPVHDAKGSGDMGVEQTTHNLDSIAHYVVGLVKTVNQDDNVEPLINDVIALTKHAIVSLKEPVDFMYFYNIYNNLAKIKAKAHGEDQNVSKYSLEMFRENVPKDLISFDLSKVPRNAADRLDWNAIDLAWSFAKDSFSVNDNPLLMNIYEQVLNNVEYIEKEIYVARKRMLEISRFASDGSIGKEEAIANIDYILQELHLRQISFFRYAMDHGYNIQSLSPETRAKCRRCLITCAGTMKTSQNKLYRMRIQEIQAAAQMYDDTGFRDFIDDSIVMLIGRDNGTSPELFFDFFCDKKVELKYKALKNEIKRVPRSEKISILHNFPAQYIIDFIARNEGTVYLNHLARALGEQRDAYDRTFDIFEHTTLRNVFDNAIRTILKQPGGREALKSLVEHTKIAYAENPSVVQYERFIRRADDIMRATTAHKSSSYISKLSPLNLLKRTKQQGRLTDTARDAPAKKSPFRSSKRTRPPN